MQKSSKIDRIRDKTDKVKGLFSLRGKDEDGSVITRQAPEVRDSPGRIHPKASHMKLNLNVN